MQILAASASNLSLYLLPSPKSRSKRVHRIHKPPYPELHQRRPPTRRGRSDSPATASGGVPPPLPNAPRGSATDAWAQPVALSPPPHTHTRVPQFPLRPSRTARTAGAAATNRPPIVFFCLFVYTYLLLLAYDYEFAVARHPPPVSPAAPINPPSPNRRTASLRFPSDTRRPRWDLPSGPVFRHCPSNFSSTQSPPASGARLLS